MACPALKRLCSSCAINLHVIYSVAQGHQPRATAAAAMGPGNCSAALAAAAAPAGASRRAICEATAGCCFWQVKPALREAGVVAVRGY